jgi:hypothetical protein
MIEQYVNKLVNDVPLLNGEKPQKIDLILDGGIFNGSYLFGGLHFLRALEKRNHVQVENISCCSIGVICALLYLADMLDIAEDLYNIIIKSFKKNYKLDDAFDKTIEQLKKHLPSNICELINHRLFISYHNVSKRKKIVKCFYKSLDDLFLAVRKSCFVPFFIDGNMLYKGKYYDGIYPYIFPPSSDKKRLHINLLGLDKLKYVFCVKNETTNIHRMLAGLLDVHLFFIKQTSTQMCSYIQPYSVFDFGYYLMRYFIEKFILVFFVFFRWFSEIIPSDIISKDSIFFKLFVKIIQDVYVVLLENICF